MDLADILDRELRGSFDFFHQFTNLNPGSRGYGLTVDSTKKPGVASIASVGFALTAWVIASERGFMDRREALAITRGTLHTLLEHASHQHGFFSHYLQMESAERFRKCEYSTIDTSLCLNGVITAAAWYQDDEVRELAERLLRRVEWDFIIFESDDKTLFRMSYNPDRQGDYVHGEPGFISRWNMAAEQKMMYLQAAGQVDPGVARRLYAGFERQTGTFEGQEIIINPGGTLFAYLFSEAWLDTAAILDPHGVDWFGNTRLAAQANRSFCMAHSGRFKTYHASSWGASAGDSPWGYDVSGSTPCLVDPRPNGTVSIFSAVACLPFLPEEVGALILHLYHDQPQTWGPYGFFDSYNLDVTPPWYSQAVYGIDKGCSMIMIENALTGSIWDIYTRSPWIQDALGILGFQEKQGDPHA